LVGGLAPGGPQGVRRGCGMVTGDHKGERAVVSTRPSAAAVSDGRTGNLFTPPRAFYRLQLNREFTFRHAETVVTYLRDLGISHCYLSSYLKARPGSAHGYDIIDHGTLNPEIGDREDFERFAASLEENGLSQILDVVPNHMGVGSDNRWWLDVLENGPSSPYASFFDINWQPLKDELRGKVLLPVLEDHYGKVLEQGMLRLIFDNQAGSFHTGYYEHRFPVDPRTYPLILSQVAGRLGGRPPGGPALLRKINYLVASFRALPPARETEPSAAHRRHRNKEALKRRLARLVSESTEAAQCIAQTVESFNGDPRRAENFDLLHDLLDRQVYRLAFWRVASDEINYRRFFDVNDLAGLRTENIEVFHRTHGLVLDLVAAGKLAGLRIDHLDGLYNPREYLVRLQEAAAGREVMGAGENSKRSRTTGHVLPLYVVVEKILADHERLAAHWPVHGTTGYEFSHLAGGLFVDPRARRALTRTYERFTGERRDFEDLLHGCKKTIMRFLLAGELNVLANLLSRIAESDRHTRDFTVNRLRDALLEVVAAFPVYRTYIEQGSVSKEDRRYVEWAVAQAKARSRPEERAIFDFVLHVLLLGTEQGSAKGPGSALCDFVMRFQQYTGPVMAKGLEDTCGYLYNRLLSLNEVGADPRRFGISAAAFHRRNRERLRDFPHAMLSTSTHDSKRSEDVRARISVLSEMPGQWEERVNRWHLLNRSRRRQVLGEAAPCANDEFGLYQNLLGAWPLEPWDSSGLEAFQNRMQRYMIKAVREAKVHSSWTHPNKAYEDAVVGFVADLLANPQDNLFLREFLPFQQQVAWLGMLNSLSQVVLKCSAPGVPDIYQGNEVWQFCLVDPDNRSPVDYDQRKSMLADLKELADVEAPLLTSRAWSLAQNMGDGRIKMYVTWRCLTLRREFPDLFAHGDYGPLKVQGLRKDHLCAFGRRHGGRILVAVAPRLCGRLLKDTGALLPLGREAWGDAAVKIPARGAGVPFRNVFTGERIEAAETREPSIAVGALLAHFPVALLVSDDSTAALKRRPSPPVIPEPQRITREPPPAR